jgi:hypothetical protein
MSRAMGARGRTRGLTLLNTGSDMVGSLIRLSISGQGSSISTAVRSRRTGLREAYALRGRRASADQRDHEHDRPPRPG